MEKHNKSTFLVLASSLAIAIIFIWNVKRPDAQGSLATRAIRNATQQLIKLGTDADKRERAILKQRMIRNAKDIAERTQDQTALEVVHFLESNGGLARPNGPKLALMEAPESEPMVFITPFRPDDECVGVWEKFRGDGAPGGIFQFIDGYNGFLAIRSLGFSGFAEGISVLHQGHLAKTMLEKGSRSSQDCSLDRDSYAFQYRLMAKIGGRKYQRIIEEAASWHAEAAENDPDFLLKPKPESDTLDDIFGKSLSAQEDDFRRLHFWMHSVFRYYESDDPKNSKARQTDFICTLLFP